MKKNMLALGFAALALLTIAAPLVAAPRGHRGGFHRRPVVVVRPWYWGWGYGPYWYDPYWYGYGAYRGYRGYGPYGYGGYRAQANWAAVDTDVSPESARVYLDGQYIGTADDFDGFPDYLYLRRGRYRLEFRLEGFEPRSMEVDARPGVKIDVKDKLAKIPGARSYGSYDTPEPRGGVRRFWGKRRDVSVEITGEDEIYGEGRDDERRGDRDDRDEEYAEDRRDRDRRDAIERERSPREEWRSRGEASPGEARLMLEIRPDDASIYLDDRFLGIASELDADSGVAVPAGRHVIVVSRPGYRDKRVEVDLSRGETENVEITLER